MTEPVDRPLVLIVDDSPHVTGPLRILFEETGRRVEVAGTVDEAVAACRRERPDLMLLDVTLPDGDGLAVIEQTTKAGTRPRVTVVLTGHDDEETVGPYRTAGAREVLLKPVAVRELLRRASEWLPARS